MKHFKPLMICLGLAVALPGLSAAETKSVYRGKTEMEAAPEALSGAKLVETTLTVEGVDKVNRYVTLKGPEGRMVTVYADARVKNLDQLKKGDQVNVKYYQGAAVNVVAPGIIRTRFHDKMTDVAKAHNIANRIPLRREGSVEDVASAAVELMRNEFITGEVLTVDGGMSMRMTA